MEKVLATLSQDFDFEDYAEIAYDDFSFAVKHALAGAKLKNKVVLVARNSNWMGKTGIVACNADASSILSKVLSFGNDEATLCKNGHRLYFKTASHDVPMGFNIEIYSGSKYILADGSLNETKAFAELA